MKSLLSNDLGSIHKFKIDMYPVNIAVILTKNILNARKDKHCIDFFGEMDPNDEPDESYMNATGVCTYDKGNVGIFLDIENNLSYSTIAHEIFHLAHKIHAYIGVPFFNDIDQANESYAYLIGFLNSKVHKILHDEDIGVSHEI